MDTPVLVLFVPDLMDRSRITAACPGARVGRAPGDATGATVVAVDLARGLDVVPAIRSHAPDARIVGFLPHEDTETAEQARALGVDAVLARSRFFRDPAAALAPPGA